MPQQPYEKARRLRAAGTFVGAGQAAVSGMREVHRETQRDKELSNQLRIQMMREVMGYKERVETRQLQRDTFEMNKELNELRMEVERAKLLKEPKPITKEIRGRLYQWDDTTGKWAEQVRVPKEPTPSGVPRLSVEEQKAKVIYDAIIKKKPNDRSFEEQSNLNKARAVLGYPIPETPEEEEEERESFLSGVGKWLFKTATPVLSGVTKLLEGKKAVAKPTKKSRFTIEKLE